MTLSFARIALQCLLCFIGLTMTNRADAATVAWSNSGRYHCIIDLSGEIRFGDAEQFEIFLHENMLADDESDNLYTEDFFQQRGLDNPSQYTTPDNLFSIFDDSGEFIVANQSGLSICLNSVGGDPLEAIKLYDLVKKYNFGTTMAGDAKCLSACAIIFVAGNYFHESTMGGNVTAGTNKNLVAGGVLGVHAPSLNIPIHDETLISKAYDDAVKLNGALIQRFASSDLPFLRRVLSTPPSEMYLFDTVEKLLEIDVDVIGIPIPSKLQKSNIVSACTNASRIFHRIIRLDTALGIIPDQSPRHWQCSYPKNGITIPDTVGSIDDISIRNMSLEGERVIVGTMTTQDLFCDEGRRNLTCKVGVSAESYAAYSADDVSMETELNFSVGFAEAGTPVESVDHVEFEWNGGPEILYAPDLTIGQLATDESARKALIFPEIRLKSESTNDTESAFALRKQGDNLILANRIELPYADYPGAEIQLDGSCLAKLRMPDEADAHTPKLEGTFTLTTGSLRIHFKDDILTSPNYSFLNAGSVALQDFMQCSA